MSVHSGRKFKPQKKKIFKKKGRTVFANVSLAAKYGQYSLSHRNVLDCISMWRAWVHESIGQKKSEMKYLHNHSGRSQWLTVDLQFMLVFFCDDNWVNGAQREIWKDIDELKWTFDRAFQFQFQFQLSFWWDWEYESCAKINLKCRPTIGK